MKTIEEAAKMHRDIMNNAPHPGGCLQYITTLSGWASNQEDMSMTFTSRVAPGDVVDPDKRESLRQGFGCVEVNIRACWGGNHHDGTPRTATEITVHVLDRLSGGMAQKTWHTTGSTCSTVIADHEVLPLLRQLLGQEPMEAILAHRKEQEQMQAQEEKAWHEMWGRELNLPKP